MNYRLTSDEMAKKFDDIRKSEAKKWKDFFDETDKMIYGDDKKKDETPKPSVQEDMSQKGYKLPDDIILYRCKQDEET